MKYRLYVDEVGNSDLGSSQNPNQRYLSLTGVIVELGYVDQVLFPEMEEVKRKYFKSHPDDPIVFHRKELVNRVAPFAELRNAKTEKAFNQEMLSKLETWQFTVVTAVLDKLQQVEQYQVWRYDPYHYCLKILVERYVRWLQRCNGTGDIMAESRGGREDIRLKNSFARIFSEGSDWVTPELIQVHLTSSQLKVKPKANNIAGLQLADLLAHPSYKTALARRNREALPDNFGGKIGQILLDSKYDRSHSGRIDGWGIKFLP